MRVNVQLSMTEIYHWLFLFSRKEGDNEFMNIIANEINTQVRLELPLLSCWFLAEYWSAKLCFSVTGNFGFSDCWRGEGTWAVCSGRTRWTGGQAGTTVRADIVFNRLHLQLKYVPFLNILHSSGFWRLCKERGLEKMAVSKAKPTVWQGEQKWRPCCRSTANVSPQQKNETCSFGSTEMHF